MRSIFAAIAEYIPMFLAFAPSPGGFREKDADGGRGSSKRGRSWASRHEERATGLSGSQALAFRIPDQALSAEEHWRRVADVIERASQTTSMITGLQSAARSQLQLAEYALDGMFRNVVPAIRLVPAPVRGGASHR